MKNQLIIMGLSLVFLILGIIILLLPVWIHPLSHQLKPGLFILGIIVSITSYISYKIHHKNYMNIKALKDRKKIVLTYWNYAPNTSNTITEAILAEKFSSFSTLILACIVGILLGVGFSLVHIPLFYVIAYVIYALSLLSLIFAYFILIKYYSNKLEVSSEAIIGDDCFYFLDQLYTLQKNMYILSQVSITTEKENCLSFIYGFCGNTIKSTYTVNIPIPPGQLEIAKYICSHYENII